MIAFLHSEETCIFGYDDIIAEEWVYFGPYLQCPSNKTQHILFIKLSRVNFPVLIIDSNIFHCKWRTLKFDEFNQPEISLFIIFIIGEQKRVDLSKNDINLHFVVEVM